MNVRCPQCQTVFRVDPEKVPVAGIRARCARCTAVFALSRSGVAARPAAAAGATQATTAAPPEPALSPAMATSTGATQASAPAAPPARMAPAAPPPPPPPAPAEPGAPGKRPSFLKQDPNTRAHRLARALVSDILAYNKDKLKEAQAAGTVKNEFREEIRKSWEEYVAQVGLDLAKSSPFFRDALNEILGKGQQIF